MVGESIIIRPDLCGDGRDGKRSLGKGNRQLFCSDRKKERKRR